MRNTLILRGDSVDVANLLADIADTTGFWPFCFPLGSRRPRTVRLVIDDTDAASLARAVRVCNKIVRRMGYGVACPPIFPQWFDRITGILTKVFDIPIGRRLSPPTVWFALSGRVNAGIRAAVWSGELGALDAMLDQLEESTSYRLAWAGRSDARVANIISESCN